MIGIDPKQYGWSKPQVLPPLSYQCGFCNNIVSSVSGYKAGHQKDGSGKQLAAVYICPHCGGPTFVDPNGNHMPDVPFGTSVNHIPEDVAKLYDEARRCTSAGAYTAAVMLCRKILMHLSVEKKAKTGESFAYYVNYLANQGYVPPNGKDWVDHIRKKGNEANHEIVTMSRDDAKDLIVFLEMLLKFMYEFPKMIPPSQPSDG